MLHNRIRTALGCWECKIDKKLEIKYIAEDVSFWEVFGLLILTWSDLGAAETKSECGDGPVGGEVCH